MDIYILDGLNGIIDILENYKSSIFNVQYNGFNDLQIVAPATQKNIDLLQKGRYVVREEDISEGEFQNVMIIENLKVDIDSESGWLITATGKGLKTLLKRRIIWEQFNLSGAIENSIRTIVNYNAVSPASPARAIPNLILDAAKGLTKTLEVQVFSENVADWIQEVCKNAGYGWDIYIKNNKYVFTMYEGTDRRSGAGAVVFSPTFDNLLSSSYQDNAADYSNAALIGGEGEGTDQVTVSIGDGNTGLDRFETYIDGGSVSSNGEYITIDTYKQLLSGYGETQLNLTKFTESFTGEVEPNGVYTLNKDYFLGDIVLIENELGISASSRIDEIIYAEDENGSSVVPTFSQWEVES